MAPRVDKGCRGCRHVPLGGLAAGDCRRVDNGTAPERAARACDEQVLIATAPVDGVTWAKQVGVAATELSAAHVEGGLPRLDSHHAHSTATSVRRAHREPRAIGGPLDRLWRRDSHDPGYRDTA